MNNVPEFADGGNFAVYHDVRANKVLILPLKLVLTNGHDGKFVALLGVGKFYGEINLVRSKPGKLASVCRFDGCKRRAVVDECAVFESERNVKRVADKTVVGAV